MTWLRWIVVCRFGARCAKLDIRPVDSQMPGYWIVARYNCGNCGRSKTQRVPT